ncbi:MAG TPA: hypothetical protein DDW17_09390 [Deltaproteobacteria bacterium]|nr:hypothetical protein [Deltaproteobacteria bacterium]
MYNKFLGEGKRFVTRLAKTRNLVYKGIRKNCHDIAGALSYPHEPVIIKYEKGEKQKTTIFYNALPVCLHGNAVGRSAILNSATM